MPSDLVCKHELPWLAVLNERWCAQQAGCAAFIASLSPVGGGAVALVHRVFPCECRRGRNSVVTDCRRNSAPAYNKNTPSLFPLGHLHQGFHQAGLACPPWPSALSSILSSSTILSPHSCSRPVPLASLPQNLGRASSTSPPRLELALGTDGSSGSHSIDSGRRTGAWAWRSLLVGVELGEEAAESG